VTEIVTGERLDAERLAWVGELYGAADPKYRDREFLQHLLLHGPAGPALHAFAIADERPVGHCAVVPLPARRGPSALRTGKLEALFVAPSHRGRRPDGEIVVQSLLTRLYALADARDVDLVHAYVTAAVGRVTGFDPLAVGERSLVAVLAPRGAPVPRRVVGIGQHGVQAAGGLIAARGRRPRVIVRRPTASDIDLADAPSPPAGRWTSLARDVWDWYCASPVIRVVELDGRDGSRALVQVARSGGEAVRLAAWRPARAGLRPALLLVDALVRLARRSGAAALRFQPWDSPAADGALVTACRLLGLVRRDDLTTLWVRTADAELRRADAVTPTPVFYLGF